MIETINFSTEASTEMVNLTDRVREIVADTNLSEGLCVVHSQHTTAGIILNSASDPATPKDVLEQLDRIVPTRVDFEHTLDTPADAAGHVKIAIVGNSALIPIIDNKLCLGKSQSILFCEFDGPRDRRALVQLLPGS